MTSLDSSISAAWDKIQGMIDSLIVMLPNVENCIDLPYPTRQILFHDQTEETDGDRARQREGWPAGNKEVPKPRSISGSLKRLAQIQASRNGSAGKPKQAQTANDEQ